MFKPKYAARSVAAVLLCLSLALTGLSAQEEAGPEERLAALSTIPRDQIEMLNRYWKDSPNFGLFVIGDEIAGLAKEYQELYDAEGAEGVAARIMKKYQTDEATGEMAAAGLALLADAGYGKKRSMLPKQMFRSKEEDAEKLLKSVSAVIEQIEATGQPLARMAAIELLLQAHCEGIVCLHNMSGNGGRNGIVLPHAVTALAAPYLEDEDPFVRALADWTISVEVCNQNDSKGRPHPNPPNRWTKHVGRGNSWPMENPPEWFEKYMAVKAEQHLPYDYVRQAVTLGMHRRPQDLKRLALDVTARAARRKRWVESHGGDTTALEEADNAVVVALQQLDSALDHGEPLAMHERYLDWRRAVRTLVMQGPDINFDSVAFIHRHSIKSHLQPGVHSASQSPDGGDILVQKGLEPGSELQPMGLQEKISNGYASDLDLWYEGDRIVFSWKKGDVQKLFEINVDGTGLQQVTEGPFDDVDPAYLPNGEIVFGSTRANAGIMCHGSSGLGHVPQDGASGTFSGLHTNIYRTLAGRSKVERISYCKDDDAYPHVLNDGRVVYMRWDYQERDVNEIFSLWVMYPDGTGADGYHKVHVPAKETIQALRDTRAVPGSTKLVSAGGGHYNYAEGAVVLGDPEGGINNPDSLKNVTPYASPVLYGWGELAPVEEGGVPYVGGYYCKPWALSEKSFLVSASYDQPLSNNFQVYYIDAWGNKELIHRDKLYETISAAPIVARERPPVLPDRTNDEKTYATLYTENVYENVPELKKGDVKYIRILQMIHWVKRAGQPGVQWHPLANASECFAFGGTGGPVRTVGLVPVHEDGSAYFEVPSDADIYFQALDENFRAVRRMRTHVEFQPGENRGCVGCHETKSLTAAPVRSDTLAMQKPAARPAAPPWGETTLLDYEEHIQPIFDEKCVKCHAGKADQKAPILTSTRDQHGFMQGYRALFGLKPDDVTPDVRWSVTGVVDRRKVKMPRNHEHPWWDVMFEDIYVRGKTRGLVTEINQFGAVRHPLARKLVEDEKHHKRLTEDEMQMLMNFFDVQAPYFSTFRQRERRDLIQVRLEPYPPFGESREHTIHYGQDVTPKLDLGK